MCSYTVEILSNIERKVEYQFARFQDTVCNIVERWNTHNVLCKAENDNIVFKLKICLFDI